MILTSTVLELGLNLSVFDVLDYRFHFHQSMAPAAAASSDNIKPRGSFIKYFGLPTCTFEIEYIDVSRFYIPFI